MSRNILIEDDHLMQTMRQHSKVARIGRLANPTKRCSCCDGELISEELSLMCKASDFIHAGVLFPFGLLFICSLFCILNICLNLLGTSCQKSNDMPCISSITNSLGPNDVDYLNLQTSVNHVFIIAGIIYLQFASFILKQRRRDLQIPTQQQYSVILKGKPTMSFVDLYEHCVQVQKKAQLIYNRKNNILKLGVVMRIYQSQNQQQAGTINDERKFNEIPDTFRNSLIGRNIQKRMEVDFSGKVILVFEKPIRAQLLNIPKLEQITDASDIIWQNIGLKSQKSKKIVMLIAVGFLMGITFLIILFMKKWIKKISTGQHQIFVIFLNLCIATVVAIFNSIEGIVIRACARRELYYCHSKFFRIVARRLSYIFFVNMVMTSFFANFIFFLEQKNTDRNFLIPIDYTGLVNDFFFLFLTNSYMSSIFNYFDIFYGVKLLKRMKIKKDPKNNNFSIEQTKFIFEGHPVDMGLRYGNVMKTLFFTASICPFVPSGAIFSLLGMFICYWVDKYLLLRRYTCRFELSGDFAQEMTQFGKFFIVMYSISNLLLQLIPLNNKGEPDSTEFSWIQLYISATLCFITLFYKFYFEKIKLYFWKQKVDPYETQMNYSQAAPFFRSKFQDKLTMISIRELVRRSHDSQPIFNKQRMDEKQIESLKESIILNNFDEDTI